MRILELWRFPVKSLQGEQVDAVTVAREGLEGDRRYAIFDATTGFGLTGRREPQLLFASAHTTVDGGVAITLPDGTVAGDDDALSGWLGRPVTLRSTDDSRPREYENPVDAEREATGEWHAFTGAQGSFRDSEVAAISIVSTATLGDWPQRRFRANIVVDGSREDDLVGSVLRIGDAVVEVRERVSRCVMVTRAQPGLGRDVEVLRAVHRERDHTISVGATIVRDGRIAVGDDVRPLGE